MVLTGWPICSLKPSTHEGNWNTKHVCQESMKFHATLSNTKFHKCLLCLMNYYHDAERKIYTLYLRIICMSYKHSWFWNMYQYCDVHAVE
jgi:hypothetical protein